MTIIEAGVKYAVRAVKIGPQNWRWYGVPEGHFIPWREAMRRLEPSAAGFHGIEGRLQPYGPFVQRYEGGSPTPKHRWWVSETEVGAPEIGDEVGPGRQLVAEVSYQVEGEEIGARRVGLGTATDFSREEWFRWSEKARGYAQMFAEAEGIDVDEVDIIEAQWYQREFHRVGP